MSATATTYKKKNENNLLSSFDNEGFYYINNTHFEKYNSDNSNHTELTFKQGEIVDINQTTICPGEIQSIMDYEEFEKNKDAIQCYRPVLKGKKVRFYKLAEAGQDYIVMMSRENVIYPTNQEDFMMTDKEIMMQVNYSLLEHNKCYYATIVNATDYNNNDDGGSNCSKEFHKIILTYVTKIDDPILKVPNLDLDDKKSVFKYHANYNSCSKDANQDAMQVFKTELNSSSSSSNFDYNNNQNNGIVFYRNDGQPFEFWMPSYSIIKSQEKPYNIPTPEYYIMLLNSYPIGNTYQKFFQDLHYDVDLYLKSYPEHTHLFELFETKLDMYITLKVKQITNHRNENENENEDEDEDYFDYDELKIKIIKELLNIDCVEPIPNRRCDDLCTCASAVPCNVKTLKTPEQIIAILNKETNPFI
jgi:hypothetical protein